MSERNVYGGLGLSFIRVMTWQTKGMKITGLSEDKGVKERTG